MKIREATHLDFDAIYKLLKRLNDSSLSKSDWEKITRVDFNTLHKHYGYVLEDDTELLGFLGTVFSERSLNGKHVKFCNIHSWIVDPKARTGGMTLLLKVLKLKDYVITNFTASDGPYKIFKSLKFKEIEYKNYKLFPIQSIGKASKVHVHRINDKNAEVLLDEYEFALYADHKRFNNVQFLYLDIGGATSFVITKRKFYVPRVFHKIPLLKKFFENNICLAEIQYLRNPKVFFLSFLQTKTAVKICSKLGSIGIIVANRYLPVSSLLKKKHYPSKRPYMYRHAEDDDLIDTLYSELFILNF
jgi:hypothetical protein